MKPDTPPLSDTADALFNAIAPVLDAHESDPADALAALIVVVTWFARVQGVPGDVVVAAVAESVGCADRALSN